MGFGIIIILLLLFFTAFVIVQGTLAQLHWRRLVEDGDIDAIRQLFEAEVEHWHSARVPKEVPALLWHGIQTVELMDVTPTAARLSCDAEGEYALQDGKRVETSNPVSEGMKITMKLAEMALYDVPNVKLDQVQIDVYTSFRDDSGRAETRCVLSTRVKRNAVEQIDWEETAAADFITLTEGRFVANGDGRLRAVEPLIWTNAAPGSS